MEASAGLHAKQLELGRIEREIAKLIQAIKEGVPGREVREPMTALSDRKEQLKQELAVVQEPKPLLHPNMASVYREKVMTLRAALEKEEDRPRASEAIRGLIEAIVLEPDGKQYRILVQGDLAAMLQLAANEKGRPLGTTFRFRSKWLRGRDTNWIGRLVSSHNSVPLI